MDSLSRTAARIITLALLAIPLEAQTQLRKLDQPRIAIDSLLHSARPSIDEPPVDVFVTRSAARFPNVMARTNKGVTSLTPPVIVLVHNDSERVYSRHETMHLVAGRAWGPSRYATAWLVEGLATFADGRCQSTSTIAVARDLLHADPTLTATTLMGRFLTMTDRRSRLRTSARAAHFCAS